MKKSVVLPYDRYQQLIQNKKEPPVETSVNLELAQAIEPPHTTTLKSPLSKEKLSSSVIIACLPKKAEIRRNSSWITLKNIQSLTGIRQET